MSPTGDDKHRALLLEAMQACMDSDARDRFEHILEHPEAAEPDAPRTLAELVDRCALDGRKCPGWLFPIVHRHYGAVYFVQEKTRSNDWTGLIKIGHTTRRVKDRVKNLQTANGRKLILRAWTPGRPETEAALHAKFAGFREHGEWFRAADHLVDLIQGLA